MVELLAPAGSLQKAKTALDYGADAIYIGSSEFSLRAAASHIPEKDLIEIAAYAHQKGKKVYVTVNIIPDDEEVERVQQYLKRLDEIGVDGIIVSSPAIIELAKEIHPSYEIHLSTQHSTLNEKALDFWKEQGIDRIVLAREASLSEIEEMAGHSMPLEVFIHGGMCSGYSGRCSLSLKMCGRDANKGDCAHSCRWSYDIFDENGVQINNQLDFSIASRDLCALPVLEKLLDAGVASLKIEGRMKSSYYIATVVSAYRAFIDEWEKGKPLSKEFIQEITDQLSACEKRATFSGFLEEIPKASGHIYQSEPSFEALYAGKILKKENNQLLIEVHNKFYKDDLLEILAPGKKPFQIRLESMKDEEGNEIEMINHPMSRIWIGYQGELPETGILRKREKS